MKSIEYDLRYLQSGVEELEEYLLSNDVFWPLGGKPPEGEPDYPQLTLDMLLLVKARLQGYHLVNEQKTQVDQAISKLDMLRSKWKVAWEKKAGQCFSARSRMWRDFLQEYKENPQDNASRYSYEVRLRAMLELSKDEYRQQAAEIEFLSSLDGYLKSMLQPGGFIWEPGIEAGFAEGKYWFLYGKLPARIGS